MKNKLTIHSIVVFKENQFVDNVTSVLTEEC